MGWSDFYMGRVFAVLTLLLIIIYLSFISLGLPDALLGSAWPVMNADLEAPLSFAGILSMIVSGGTIISSMMSYRLTRRFGTGAVTAVSVAMTAAALLGYSMSPSFWLLCAMAVPLGLGAGAVDAALNNFVSLHYQARHMNWLHCFWGIGATLGPYIMSIRLLEQNGWRFGYRTVGFLQTGLVVILFATLFLWKRVEGVRGGEEQESLPKALGFFEVLRLPKAKVTMLALFTYCALEITTGLWGASFLVVGKGIPAQTAARWISYYYLGITVGRFFSGFLSMRLDNKRMERLGLVVIGIGVLLLLLSPWDGLLLAGLLLIGLGCAPIYPSILHDTPKRFGRENAQAVMGIQMACAYVGSTLMPPLFGVLAQWVTPGLLPAFLLALFLVEFFVTERANHGLREEPED